MSRWFRMYDELLDNPKVQRLSGDDFKAWVNMLCLASRSDGLLPPVEDIAFGLRIDPKKASATVGRLVSAKLLEQAEGGFRPHNWNDRQYKSDVSTDRVKRFRERSKKRDETVSETPPDTETDTEQSSVTDVTDATASKVIPLDPAKVMFDSGLSLLAAAGYDRPKAAPLIGRWRREAGDAAVIDALGRAHREAPSDLIPFIEGCLRNANRKPDTRSVRGGRPDPAIDLLRSAQAAEREEAASGYPEADRGVGTALPSYLTSRS